MEPSEGEITRSRGLTVGHVEQDVPQALMDRPFHAAVLEALSDDQRLTESWRVDVALESLEVPEALRQRPLKHLSGGWQRLAMLARVLVTDADVLLLDEPTNHLDLARIGRLENWLNALPREMPVADGVAIQRGQDATLAFRYACRVGMCGSCAMVVNGRERWACRTRLATLGSGPVTVRPLYHFPLLRDLVVDMTPFVERQRGVERR